MDFRYDAHIQSCSNTIYFSYVQVSQVDPTNLSPQEMNITPTEHPNSIGMMDNMAPFCVGPADGDDNAAVEPADDDDPDAVDNVPHVNNMQVAARILEDDDEEVETGYANNEYVGPKNPHPDEFEGDDWVHSTYMENIRAEFNLSIARTVTDDLKVGDIFETKIKLLEAIIEWSLMCGVSFTQVKSNKMKLHNSLCFHCRGRQGSIDMFSDFTSNLSA